MACLLFFVPSQMAQAQSLDWNSTIRATPALKPIQVDCDPQQSLCQYTVSAPLPTVQRVPAQKSFTESVMLDTAHPTSVTLGSDTFAAIQFAAGAGPSKGALFYKLNAGVPQYVAGFIGDNLTFTSRNGRLVVREEVGGAGNSLQCGPYGVHEAEYSLSGNQLRRIAWRNEGISRNACAVWNFYVNLSAGQYQNAYDALAPAYRAQRPYEQWLKDAQANEYDVSSLKLSVEAQLGQKPQTALVRADVGILPRATATGASDKTRFDNATRYLVTWQMVWDSKAEKWLLTWLDSQPAK
jgi:hypothetical protein